MPHAGISWTRDTVGGHAKIFLGILAVDTPGNKSTEGLYTIKNEICQRLFDAMPDVPEFMKEGTTKHNTDPAEVVVRRAYECRPVERGGKNELFRFLQPDWKMSYDYMLDVYKNSKTVHLDDLCHIMAKRFRIEFSGQPGVYINQNTKDCRQVYVGESEDIALRQSGHTNGFWRTAFGLPCSSKAMAKALQDSIHDLLQGKYSHLVDWPPGTRGAYCFKKDNVEGAHQVMLLTEQNFPRFFRQAVEVAPTILKPAQPSIWVP